MFFVVLCDYVVRQLFASGRAEVSRIECVSGCEKRREKERLKAKRKNKERVRKGDRER